MDRFKFRIYDVKLKMYYSDGRYINGNQYMDSYFEDVYDLTDDMIVEQCTGLKDKNGNLIYIGDIIKCGNGPLNTATVKYENGENFIDGIYPFNLYHDCGDTCHCQLRNYPEYACEIIGNIHEQKD